MTIRMNSKKKKNSELLYMMLSYIQPHIAYNIFYYSYLPYKEKTMYY